ncbi:uncharacterized protein LOC119997112 isoform X1 [Tripterygium wilfordii]|uniref:uncharacterized protein LOC119997112 isoform X1 n=1 Tax=Tripterygium wilfordii TaxID=458696 RepID=UPI0018F84266|nr:uncharacterized protein LOC119997112 isoform X1 [Tripterygium wilfordii]
MLGSPDGFDKIHILTQVGFLLQCSMDYGRHFPAVEDLKGFCYWPKPKLIDAVKQNRPCRSQKIFHFHSQGKKNVTKIEPFFMGFFFNYYFEDTLIYFYNNSLINLRKQIP